DRESGDAGDDGRERGGDGDLLDPRHHGPNGHRARDGERACGEPGDLHGDGDGGDGGDDCGEQSHEPAGDGGGRRRLTAVGDREGDGDGGDGGDDCGEQSDEAAGDGGGRRRFATVGDREGRERESRCRGGGDAQRDRGQRDRESGDARDDGRERGGDGDLLDPRHGRPNGYGPGDGERACGEIGRASCRERV